MIGIFQDDMYDIASGVTSTSDGVAPDKLCASSPLSTLQSGGGWLS